MGHLGLRMAGGIGLCLAAFASPSGADTRLDQINEVYSASGPEARAGQMLAQTFTVGITGTLAYVDMWLWDSGHPATDDLLVEIWSTNGGLPQSSALAKVTLGPEDVQDVNNRVYTRADFTGAGLLFTAGEVLAIVLRTEAAADPGGYDWFGNDDPSDGVYARGEGFASLDGGIIWQVVAPGFDYMFRTYVDVDVTPVDFNDLTPGDILTDQYSEVGATFSLAPSPTEPGSPLPPPDGPTTWSLGPVDQFGVNGNSILVGPTTTGPFYDVQLDFTRPADYFSIMALDQDRLSDLRVQAFRRDQLLPLTVTTTLVGEISALPYVSGPVYRVELGQIGGSVQFDRVVFGGTEQFDNLAFSLVATCRSTVLTLAQLRAEVEALNTSPATRQALQSNLDNVQTALDNGKNRTARTRLTNLIQTLVNRSNFASTNPNYIPPAEANDLVCGTANVLGGIPLQ